MNVNRVSLAVVASLVLSPFVSTFSFADDASIVEPMSVKNANGNPVHVSVLPGLCPIFVSELVEVAKTTKGITVFAVPTGPVSKTVRTCAEKGAPKNVTRATGPNRAEARAAALKECNELRPANSSPCVVVGRTTVIEN